MRSSATLAPMSPRSRGRKSAKKVRHQTSARAASGSRDLREPRFRDSRDTIVKNLALLSDAAEVPSPYDAEVLTSVILGHLFQAGVPEPALTRILLDAVDELRRRGCYPALQALALQGPPGVRDYSATAAGLLDARGERRRPWLVDIGDVTPGTCQMATSAAGDTTLVSCEFSYADGSSPHVVLAVLDAAWHGAPSALLIGENPAQTRARLALNAWRVGAEIREVPGPQAASVLLAAIDALIDHGPPPEHDRREENFSVACSSLSVARQRAGLLLGGAPRVRDRLEDRWPQAARDQLAAEFLASTQARELTSMVSRTIPRFFIARSVLDLGCDPTVASPAMLRRLLLGIVPDAVIAPDRYGEEIPAAARAWLEWLMDRRALDRPIRKHFRRQLDATLRKFPAAWNGPPAAPYRRYVEDLPDEVCCDGDKVIPVAERRRFAVPFPADRASGTVAGKSGRAARDVDTLDAADPVDRQLITINDLSARMISQQDFGAYVAVVEQLWAGEPDDLWPAVQRMLAAGDSREKVLDRLARRHARSQEGDDVRARVAAR